MITINDKKDCCGCWACYNVCPKHCIEMEEDEEGFRYPVINMQACIDCGLCERVCPLKKPQEPEKNPLSYVIQNKDAYVRRHSTSGGFYAVISDWVVKKGGVVFGVSFEEDNVVRHSYAETIEGCEKYQVSKYAQSLIGDTYRQAKEFLKDGRWVVFSGTPCQIAGLYGYLCGAKYEKLITVDLVCRGTPSPRLLERYLKYQELIYGSKVTDWKSRDKYYGYDYSTTNIEFENKRIAYHKGSESDLLFRLYFKNICSRPSCYQCHFRTLHRVSDFTIFDCWDAPSVNKKFDRNGATNVFIHTQKGRAVFDSLKPYFVWDESDINSVIERDGVMIKHNVPKNSQRKEFFADLENLSMDKIEKKYLNCSFPQKIIISLKPTLYRLGIFKVYMSIKNFLLSMHLLSRI